MNILAVISSAEFRADASAAEEYVRKNLGGTATVTPCFDYRGGQVKGWRFVIGGSTRTVARSSYVAPQHATP